MRGRLRNGWRGWAFDAFGFAWILEAIASDEGVNVWNIGTLFWRVQSKSLCCNGQSYLGTRHTVQWIYYVFFSRAVILDTHFCDIKIGGFLIDVYLNGFSHVPVDTHRCHLHLCVSSPLLKFRQSRDEGSCTELPRHPCFFWSNPPLHSFRIQADESACKHFFFAVMITQFGTCPGFKPYSWWPAMNDIPLRKSVMHQILESRGGIPGDWPSFTFSYIDLLPIWHDNEASSWEFLCEILIRHQFNDVIRSISLHPIL